MSRNYSMLGQFFYADDDGYFDGCEVSRKPYHPKRKDLFSNADSAKSQINLNAKPVDLNFGDFCYQLTEPSFPSDDPNYLFESDEDDIDLTDPVKVTESINEFEVSIKSLQFEIKNLDAKYDEICALNVPEDISYEERSSKCDQVADKVDKIHAVMDSIQTKEYLVSKSNFIQSLSEHSAPPILPMNAFSAFSASEVKLLKSILLFDESKIPYEKDFLTHVVYLASGGGKSVLADKCRSQFEIKLYDIDQIMYEDWNYFSVVERFQNILVKPGKFRNMANQHYFHVKREKYRGSLLLLNHPNQVPAYYRRHELIIVPKNFNWNLRFFNYNFFSLLAVRGKYRVLSGYDGYLGVIKDFLSKR